MSDSGGYAFPNAGTLSGGMSLRDVFALAVIGEIFKHAADMVPYDDIADNAYNLADAMLERRKQ